jgi:glycine cleavage system transcriptional repressor
MTVKALISILGEDRTGLIAAIAGRLYDIGANLGDTTFAVLGSAAEFTAVCELPDGTSLETVEGDLKGLPFLAGAKVKVRPFAYGMTHGPAAQITHRIEMAGDDSPGLVARLAEAFVGYGANIVRLNSEREVGRDGAHYTTRIDVWIPPAKAQACLATVANTARQMGLTCRWEGTGGG